MGNNPSLGPPHRSAIGVAQKGWPAGETLESFTKLTIGDGLVSQVPSFVIAIAAGLIVTRSTSKSDLGQELTSQLTAQPVALGMTAAFLVLLAFTGLPFVPMMGLGAVFALAAFFSNRRDTDAAAEVAEAEQKKTAEPEQAPVENLLQVDTLRLEIGYALVRLVDKRQGGDLLERIKKIRRELAVELGIVVPPIRINDNMHLQPNDYHVKLRGNTVASGVVYPGKLLAVDTGVVTDAVEGVKTREPAFGQDAWWVEPETKQRAETYNYLVVDSTSVLATHLSEVIKNHAEELLTREETNSLLDQLKEKSPKLIEEVIGDSLKTGELQKVMQNLLRERVPVRDLEAILETLGDWSTRTKDLDVLTEYARNALRRTICTTYTEVDPETGKGRLFCVTLDPALEDLVNGYIDRAQGGTTMTMPPAVANRVTTAILGELQKLLTAGHHPLVLASPQVRAQVRALLEPHLPSVAVMGYNEVSKGVEVESMGLVHVDVGGNGSDGTTQSAAGEPGGRLQGVMT
ncbi:MAG: FHIPEP family type III secretion protein [Proteobacteria bacterium]|nr:FHIPEP family type III secretion protein [Pseudomonadota bacterium]